MRPWPVTAGRVKVSLGGIKLRLAGMIMVAVLPLIVVHALDLYQNREHQITAAGTKALELARRGADLYREPIIEAQTLLQIAAHVPEVADAVPGSCELFLELASRDRSWANGLWVIGPDGRVVCSTVVGGLGLDVSGRDYFRQAIERREFIVSDFFNSKLRGLPTSVVALPVLSPDGSVKKLLAASLRLSWFSRLAAEIGQKENVRVMLFDGQGTLLARFPERPEWIGKNWRGYPLMNEAARKSDGWAMVDSKVGPAQIYGWTQIAGTQARIAVGFTSADVLGRIDHQITQTALAVATALGLAMLAFVGLAGGIVRPLKILTAGAEAARKSHEAELPSVTGYREVESLAASLQELLADRKQREDALAAARAAAEMAVEQARAAHTRLRDAIEAVPVGLVFFDADDRYVLWNSRYMELYPHISDPPTPGERFDERLRAGITKGYFPQAAGREEEWLTHRLSLHRDYQSSHEQLLPGNRWLRIEERRTSDGGSIGIRVDITESKRREESIRLLFEHNPIPMWVVDRETLRFLAVNDAAVAHYGYSREQFLAMTILDLRPDEERARAGEATRSEEPATGTTTWRHLKADGSAISVNIFSRAMIYENRPAKIAAVIDVTERQRVEARITHMAHHDGLTDLANRILFRQRLEQALARAREPDTGLAIHCIDLDYFKDVNDTLGHPIGDALLRLVGDRLRATVGKNDTVARLGGDEFAVIQEPAFGTADAGRLAQRLIEVLSAPYDIDGQEVIVAASVGIGIASDEERDPDRLLKNADMALYRAKSDGRRTFRFFEPEMDAHLQARRMLDKDLRAAFNGREFELHYQPTVDLANNDVIGFEALMRWRHPERGMVSPAEFIPIAEETGLIVPLGEWALNTACFEAAKWPSRIRVAVNLSPVQFRSGKIVETVKQALALSGLSPGRLELEITESVLFQDNDINLATLHELHRLGVRVAMDDFGTGYSSLSYLRRFPFDKIKIDRSFVKELPHDPDCLTIIRGIVGLAAGLGMSTTAEGVEKPSQLEVLRAYGCHEAQGFLFGRAAPASEIERMLAGEPASVVNAA